MRDVISVSLPRKVRRELDRVTREQGVSRSFVVRELLRRYLLTQEFRGLQDEGLGRAARRGFGSEEDVLERIS